MFFKSIIGATCTCLAIVSFNANAIVVNTLNGVEYQWLELTATQGMSRNEVEAGIAAATPDDVLYGYKYASRALVEDLYLSYATWDGIDGWHGNTAVANGVGMFFEDFGTLATEHFRTTVISVVDGPRVAVSDLWTNFMLYGDLQECGTYTCRSRITLYSNIFGMYVVAEQRSAYGWDATNTRPLFADNNFVSSDHGSLLVRVSAIPIPAAVWMFGSGFIGLIGFARCKVS